MLSFPSKAKDFPLASSSVVEALSTDTVAKALSLLQQHNILSLPVFDAESNTYLGWFDVSDMLPVFLNLDRAIQNLADSQLSTDETLNLAKAFPFSRQVRDAAGNIEHIDVTFGSASTLKECFEARLSPLFPWDPFLPSSSMTEVIISLTTISPSGSASSFSKSKLARKVRSLKPGSVKRVPIIHPKTGRVSSIISQSAIIQFVDEIIKNREKENMPLAPIFGLTCDDLGWRKEVICVEENESIRAALEIMDKYKITSIGIVDEEGKLLTCLTTRDLLRFRSLENVALNRLQVEKSVRDIEHSILDDSAELDKFSEEEKLLSKAAYAMSDLTVVDFISQVRQDEVELSPRGKAKAPIVTVRPEHDLKKVIAKLSKAKVHRVFIVDEKMYPIGVASVRDVIRVLFPSKQQKAQSAEES